MQVFLLYDVIYELHWPDRVHKQFGEVQDKSLSHKLKDHKDDLSQSRRGNAGEPWEVRHKKLIKKWDDRLRYVCRSVPPGPDGAMEVPGF